MDIILTFPVLIILIGGAVAFIGAAELGHYLGLRKQVGANAATLEAAMLGLLALVISFTFAIALNRFDARRDALLSEANSIGTTALRARMLPAPHNGASLRLLRDYTQIRLDIFKQRPSLKKLDAFIARSNDIQEALWKEAHAVVKLDNSVVPTGLYIQALNDTVDDQEKRLTALRNRVPGAVFFALYAITAVIMGFAGFASGEQKSSWRPPIYLTALLIAAVIALIDDIDRPEAGMVMVDQQPMIDTASSIAGILADLSKPEVWR